MKKLFGFTVVAFAIISVMCGCSREIKELKELKNSEVTTVSEITYVTEATINEANELVEEINDFLNTYSYENIMIELEKDDEFTYVNEIDMNNYTLVTIRDNEGYEYIMTFDGLGTLCEVGMI